MRGMDIILLISGGVDSSVALRLLHQQGYRVTACYLKIWLEDELSHLGDCPWEEDLSYARAVCKQLAVPLEVISLQREYHERVVAHTIAQVRQGYTPNPDMLCNAAIKFGAFLDIVAERFAATGRPDAEDAIPFIATGHYAQVAGGELFRSPDAIKDQTYFLALLSPAQLAQAYFPIGHLTKPEVRALAERYDLPNKARRDSQGICFLGKLSFADFLAHHLGEQEGPLREYETGQIVGIHKGFWFYTIGQRQGIGLSGGPWYVVAKSVAENTVFVSRSYYHLSEQMRVMRTEFYLNRINWLSVPITAPREVAIKLRHGPVMHAANILPVHYGEQGALTGYKIILHEPDQGIAPGQYAVLHDGMRCLGGGVMEQHGIGDIMMRDVR